MKNHFWLFRTNLKHLEYYHEYTDLDSFSEKCHDFYLLQGIWFLENDIFDKVIMWRLAKKQRDDTIFVVNGKKFIQKFVSNFSECFKYPIPKVSFFRGGFPEFCKVTRSKPEHFGLKLYLGAGKRIYPQYGGVYDKVLVEDKGDITKKYNCIPFYKTTNSEIFRPLQDQQENYDLVWICNFRQITQKGQKFFIKTVSGSEYLKSLKILHVGNKPSDGRRMCREYRVENIDFCGEVKRPELNRILNKSKAGIVTSNRKDGCPRVLTEVLMSGTPLLVRDETRFLDYYKTSSVIIYNSRTLEGEVKRLFQNYKKIKDHVIFDINGLLSMDRICKENLKLWFSP